MSDQRVVVVGLLLMILLVVIVSLLRPVSGSLPTPRRLVAAAGVAVVAAVWMLVNGELDDPVLFAVGPDQGVTVADVPSGVLFVVAVVMAARRRGHHR